MRKAAYHHGDLKNAIIKAGVEILANEGSRGFSLRKAAMKAGVSHSAPYAHFNDKQELIAAISTRGFEQLHQQIRMAAEKNQGDTKKKLLEVGWAYVQFAQKDADFFKVIFSGALENEQAFPDFVDISHRTFQLVVDLVCDGQRAGLLKQGDADVLAVSIWSMVHGFTCLLLESQISHSLLEKQPIKKLLEEMLNQLIATQDAAW